MENVEDLKKMGKEDRPNQQENEELEELKDFDKEDFGGEEKASIFEEASKGQADKPEDDSFKSKYYYLAAEMENLKKRTQKEKENLIKFGNEKILLDLLEVVDNFERSLEILRVDGDKKIKNIVAGIEMVSKQMSGILQKNGLVPVETIGKTFDPNFHEAVSQKVVEGKKDQEILEEYQKGYILNGRLLRPAKVVVAKVE